MKNFISSSLVLKTSSIRLGTTPYPIESDILPFALHFAAESISRAFATSLVDVV